MKHINLDDDTKSKIDKLPIVLKLSVNYLLDCVENIINGGCNEDEITSTMATLNQNAQGKYGKDDLLNYDQAGKILGFGCTNRMGLKKLLDKHNIKQVVINNMRCGFRKSEIMALCDKVNADIRKREIKRKNKDTKQKNKRKINIF